MEITPIKTVIETIMEEHDWTQAEFASHFKVDASQVSRWLSGKRKPNGDTRLAIYDEYRDLVKNKNKAV